MSLSSVFRASLKPRVGVPSIVESSVSVGSDSVAGILREISLLKCSQERKSNLTPQNDCPGFNSVDTSSSHDFTSKSIKKSFNQFLDIPWFSHLPKTNTAPCQKKMLRERKAKWIFRNIQERRFEQLIKSCADKVGIEAAIQLFEKLGKQTGIKEYNALIGLCIEKARNSDDEDVRRKKISVAFKLLEKMDQHGFCLEEDSVGPLFLFLAKSGMVEEFDHCRKIIKSEDQEFLSKLGYYEMLLWIKLNNRKKVKELCQYLAGGIDNRCSLCENYLRALCECNEGEEIKEIFSKIHITRISSSDCLSTVFKLLGRLLLENLAVESFSMLRENDYADGKLSVFIYEYVISMPNLRVEDTVQKFKDIHEGLRLTPLSLTYEMLVKYCCDLLKVHTALDVAHQMIEVGHEMSVGALNSILSACAESCNYHLVHHIRSMIEACELKPNCETFSLMIDLCTRMKDFEVAYSILDGAHKMNLLPTSSMYNSIIAGYLRDKNLHGALNVFERMEAAGVQPDSQTFSYLIGFSNSEKDAIKYFQKLKDDGITLTKHIHFALIHAYASCGLFEKAKQIVRSSDVAPRHLNEVQSAFVSALATHGGASDALEMYYEMKEVGATLGPKDVFPLMGCYLQCEGKLPLLLQLLRELDGSNYWIDGCCRVLLYCVRHKDVSSAIDLMKQAKGYRSTAPFVFDEVFCEIANCDPSDSEFGVFMLNGMKKEFGYQPSRKCLDFLLCSCIQSKDLKSCRSVCLEYERSCLPYNAMSLLWMYQALVSCGDHVRANAILHRIPTNDPHIRILTKACTSASAHHNKDR